MFKKKILKCKNRSFVSSSISDALLLGFFLIHVLILLIATPEPTDDLVITW